MDRNGIELAVVALRSIRRDVGLIDWLHDQCKNGLLLGLEEALVDSLIDGSYFFQDARHLSEDFCRYIHKEKSRERNLHPGFISLLKAVASRLESDIVKDKKYDQKMSLLLFDAVHTFYDVISSGNTKDREAANRLAMCFGEASDIDFINETLMSLEKNGADEEFLNALAEGANRQEGAWEVRKFYYLTGKAIREDQESCIKALKISLSNKFALPNPSQKDLRARRADIKRLTQFVGKPSAREFLQGLIS